MEKPMVVDLAEMCVCVCVRTMLSPVMTIITFLSSTRPTRNLLPDEDLAGIIKDYPEPFK